MTVSVKNVTFPAEAYVLNNGGGWQYNSSIKFVAPPQVGQEVAIDENTVLDIVRVRHVVYEKKSYMEIYLK